MNDADRALKVFKSGGLVIYPTDTAFGIGCRIDRPDSVERLFSVRRRPKQQATPVLVTGKDMALPYLLSPTEVVRRLMDHYWPGAVTIVSPCKTDIVNPLIRGGGTAMGVRMPKHLQLLRIISRLGIPVLGPSANFHGGNTPHTIDELDPELIKLVDFVLPGLCTTGSVSTVVNCVVTPYEILRQGAVELPSEQELMV